MSDEVKQAAERLRRWREMDHHNYTIPHEYRNVEKFDEWSMKADLAFLGMAWESEHANDAENALPLSAEILQASGWASMPDAFGCPVWFHDVCGISMQIRSDGKCELLCETADGFAIVGNTIETVGDLRKLLESLHVPAVVNVPKGGE